MRRARVITIAGAVVLPVAYAVARTVYAEPEALLPQLIYLIPFAVTVFLSAACVFTKPSERRFWLLLTVTLAMIFVAETAYSIVTVTSREEPGLVALSVVLYLLAGLLFVPSIQLLTRLSAVEPMRRVGHVVDLLALLVIAFVVEMHLLTAPLFTVAGVGVDYIGALSTTVLSAYGLLVAGLMIQALVTARAVRWRLWEHVLASGIALYGLVTMLSPVQYLGSIGVFPDWCGTLVESLWMLGFLAIGVGAVYRLTADDRGVVADVFYNERSQRRPWISNAIVVLALATGAWAALNAPSATGLERTVLLSTSTILAVLVAIRYTVVNWTLGGVSELSRTDPVTGLGNRRAIDDYLGGEVSDAIRAGTPFSIMVVDVAGVAQATRSFGRAERERVLVMVAHALTPLVGGDGLTARVSGAEFVFIRTHTTETQMLPLALDVRDAVLHSGMTHSIPLVVSIGIASFPTHAMDADTLLQQARSAAEWSRSEGRNKVTIFDSRIFGTERRISAESVAGLRERALRSVVTSLDASVPGRENRSSSVQMLATALARDIGMDEEHARRVGFAASVSDVGLVVVSAEAHQATRALHPDNLGGHAVLSARILAASGAEDVAPWVRAHHERWDGAGSPDGLAGERIPIESRIIMICDVYDELVSGRPGTSPLSPAAALQQIDHELCVHFDPVVGERFIRMVAEMMASAQR